MDAIQIVLVFFVILFGITAGLQVIKMNNDSILDIKQRRLDQLVAARKAAENAPDPRFTSLILDMTLEQRLAAQFPEYAQSLNSNKPVN